MNRNVEQMRKIINEQQFHYKDKSVYFVWKVCVAIEREIVRPHIENDKKYLMFSRYSWNDGKTDIGKFIVLAERP